jgi:hypothetical protein
MVLLKRRRKMDSKKAQRGEIGSGGQISGKQGSGEQGSGMRSGIPGEEKKLAILVIFMLTMVLALYGIIPFI